MADTPALRKARGAFYTPPEMSRFIARWAVRSAADRVLEPSCGEAEFLVSVAEHLRSLGAHDFLSRQLQGVELHPHAARLAADRLHAAGFATEIEVADFFEVPARPEFDAVVGNPPYVRYQHFTGKARKRGLEAALAQGVRLTALSSSWAPFLIHAAQFLRPEGRLGMVLPGELLTVNYAASIRDFLLKRFARVRLVAFEERVFPGVMEEVVLLLAEGSGGAPDFEIHHVRGLAALERLEDDARRWSPLETASKWTAALLERGAREAYQALELDHGFVPLLEWGRVSLGSVTGNNDYFTLTEAEADALGLPERERLPLSPPGSRHLRGAELTAEDWDALRAAGARVFLFHPDRDDPSPQALRYIEAGEAKGVHGAYKCRVRTPWWRVPVVKTADLFLTYMNHAGPRLVANRVGVAHLNSLHGVALHPERRDLGRMLLPVAALNSATLLSAEIVGRAYGGGLLKLEPREAGRWLVPSPEAIERAAVWLAGLRGAAQDARENMAALVDAVDQALLVEGLGMQPETLSEIREARTLLTSRRTSRAGRARGTR